jgi:hypothetical protein
VRTATGASSRAASRISASLTKPGAVARKLVTEVGDFVLGYVSTPVEVCVA